MNITRQKNKSGANIKVDKPYKYKINEILAGMGPYKASKTRALILSTAQISEATFSRYINAKWNESTDIPGRVLLIISNILYVPMEELCNEKPISK